MASIVFDNGNVVGTSTDGVRDVAVADFDNDGDMDIVSVGDNRKVIVWQNDGTPFSGLWNQNDVGSLADIVFSVAVGDIDKDGDIDIITGSGPAEDYSLVAWENDGTPFDGGWTRSYVGFGGPGMTYFKTADFDNDGYLDIVTSVRYNPPQPQYVLRNDHSPFDGAWTSNSFGRIMPGFAAITDFDLDGDNDFVNDDGTNRNIVAWENDGTPFSGLWTKYNFGTPSTNVWYALTVADFDRDGDMDVVSGGVPPTGYHVTVWENLQIQNRPPIAEAGPDQIVNEGEMSFSGSFTDPDPADTHTISWDFGDGSESTIGTLTPTHVYADNGFYTVILTVTDSSGLTGTDTLSVTVNNVAPTAIFAATGPIDEGSSSTLSLATPSDPATADTAAGFHYSFACDGLDPSLASAYALAGTASTATCTFNDNSDHIVKSRIFDKDDGYTTYEATVSVNNAAPVITSTTGPSGPLALGSSASVTASFTDAGSLDTHTCTISWDDGTSSPGTVTESGGSGSCTGSRTYAAAGVYTVGITVSDDDAAGAASMFEYVVVYDPGAGFVTGGGWINSPAGAYAADPAMTGRANFGFVSKYQKGANTPLGETEFQFKAGNLNFHSTVYEWLVVAGAKAQYKGSGTINGAGDYGFLLTATDGQMTGGGGVDKFRIKIVDKAAGTVVYDNVNAGSDDIDTANPQAIGGGSIVIHK